MYEPLRIFLTKLGPLPEEDWLYLVSRLALVKKSRNELLLRTGDTEDHLYFVLEGVVRIAQRIEGKEITRNIFTEGDFFSESVSLFTRQPTQMSVDCLEDCLLITIPHTHFDAAVTRSKALAAITLRLMQRIVVFLARRGADAYRTGSERYHELLKAKPSLLHRVPKYIIASYLGLSPEAFSRILAQHKSGEIDLRQD